VGRALRLKKIGQASLHKSRMYSTLLSYSVLVFHFHGRPFCHSMRMVSFFPLGSLALPWEGEGGTLCSLYFLVFGT
jgi:hypothetical protein